eukprot:scaffold4110_cov105-Isochrysis_galbana.AAC.1
MEGVGCPRGRRGVRLGCDDVDTRAQRGGQVDGVTDDGGGADQNWPTGGAGARAEEAVGGEDDAGSLGGGAGRGLHGPRRKGGESWVRVPGGGGGERMVRHAGDAG